MQYFVDFSNEKRLWRSVVMSKVKRAHRYHVFVFIISFIVCAPVFAGNKGPEFFNLDSVSEKGTFHCISELTFRGKPVCVYLSDEWQESTADIISGFVSSGYLINTTSRPVSDDGSCEGSDDRKRACDYFGAHGNFLYVSWLPWWWTGAVVLIVCFGVILYL